MEYIIIFEFDLMNSKFNSLKEIRLFSIKKKNQRPNKIRFKKIEDNK